MTKTQAQLMRELMDAFQDETDRSTLLNESEQLNEKGLLGRLGQKIMSKMPGNRDLEKSSIANYKEMLNAWKKYIKMRDGKTGESRSKAWKDAEYADRLEILNTFLKKKFKFKDEHLNRIKKEYVGKDGEGKVSLDTAADKSNDEGEVKQEETDYSASIYENKQINEWFTSPMVKNYLNDAATYAAYLDSEDADETDSESVAKTDSGQNVTVDPDTKKVADAIGATDIEEAVRKYANMKPKDAVAAIKKNNGDSFLEELAAIGVTEILKKTG